MQIVQLVFFPHLMLHACVQTFAPDGILESLKELNTALVALCKASMKRGAKKAHETEWLILLTN
jgi:hypothetical protein